MIPKERVLTSLNHQEPDRVPINYAGANSDILRRLQEHFGLNENDNDGLLEALHIDFRVIDIPYTGPQLHKPVEGKHVDPLWGIHTRRVIGYKVDKKYETGPCRTLTISTIVP